MSLLLSIFVPKTLKRKDNSISKNAIIQSIKPVNREDNDDLSPSGREDECKEKVAAITEQFDKSREGELLLEEVFLLRGSEGPYIRVYVILPKPKYFKIIYPLEISPDFSHAKMYENVENFNLWLRLNFIGA